MRVECVFCVYAVGSAGVPAHKKLSVFLTQRRRDAEVWHGHLARVSWAEPPMHANRCAMNVYGIQARGAPGGASVCLPADEQTLVPPILRSKTKKKKLRNLRKSVDKTRKRKAHFVPTLRPTHLVETLRRWGNRLGVETKCVRLRVGTKRVSAYGAERKRCRDPRTARLLSPHSKFCRHAAHSIPIMSIMSNLAVPQ